jgi:hypothetical protein
VLGQHVLGEHAPRGDGRGQLAAPVLLDAPLAGQDPLVQRLAAGGEPPAGLRGSEAGQDRGDRLDGRRPDALLDERVVAEGVVEVEDDPGEPGFSARQGS